MTPDQFPTRPDLQEVERRLRALRPLPYRGRLPRLGEAEVNPNMDSEGQKRTPVHEGPVGTKEHNTWGHFWRLALAASIFIAVTAGTIWVFRREKPLLPGAGPQIAVDEGNKNAESPSASPQVVQSSSRVLKQGQTGYSNKLDAANQQQDLSNPVRPEDEAVVGAPVSPHTKKQGG